MYLGAVFNYNDYLLFSKIKYKENFICLLFIYMIFVKLMTSPMVKSGN
jgi:hypothetical protein